MKMNMMMNATLIFCYSLLYAAPFTITPKAGINFPTQMTPGYDVQAYYTITNNTEIDFTDVYVQYLPLNVEQITTGGLYNDTCGSRFDLNAGASATLAFNISGPVSSDASNPMTSLFVCLPGGTVGSGTNNPLAVIETPFALLSVSYEIIYIVDATLYPLSFLQTYKEGGTNAITEDEWNDYEPSDEYVKNNTRYLQFNEQIYIGSPGYPNGSTIYITTEGGTPSDGYTWGEISNVVNAMWPWSMDPASDFYYEGTDNPFEAANLFDSPVAGGVKVTANYKSQIMKFYACENGVAPGTPGAIPILRYFITDQWGNQYIMHASDYSTPNEVDTAFLSAVLPDSWSKQSTYLSEDFYLYPAQGSDNSYEYTLVRDNENNTYHQMKWNPEIGIVIATQIQETGMPVWGGRANGRLLINNGLNNVIYGGGGVNTFQFDTATSGTNTIIGFNPAGGDLLDFQDTSYLAFVYPEGVKIEFEGVNSLAVILSQVFTFNDDWVVKS